MGGMAALTFLGLLAGLAFWSWRTFSFRARRRLIEDQVYSIVIGAQSSNVHTWGHHRAEREEQVRFREFQIRAKNSSQQA